MRNSFCIVAILAFLFSSCEKPADLDLPAQPPRLGVHAIWSINNVLEVQVTRTFSITETPQFDYQTDPTTVENKRKKYSVANARVQVYKNNELYDELTFDSQAYIYKSSSGKIATPDANYSVVVSAPGFEEVKSPVATFPGTVTIKKIEIKKRVASDGAEGVLDEVTIEFDDPAAIKNYYWITITREYPNSAPQRYYYPVSVYPVDNDFILPSGSGITTDMPVVQGDRLLVKDDNFNGQTKRLTIRMSSWILESVANSGAKAAISLNNVNEDLYTYVRSRLLDADNPFATPVQAYSNITNGIGIFGLYAGESRELR